MSPKNVLNLLLLIKKCILVGVTHLQTIAMYNSGSKRCCVFVATWAWTRRRKPTEKKKKNETWWGGTVETTKVADACGTSPVRRHGWKKVKSSCRQNGTWKMDHAAMIRLLEFPKKLKKGYNFHFPCCAFCV